jgi:pimeloyl-ACP methyl ester carboxylesterase
MFKLWKRIVTGKPRVRVFLVCFFLLTGWLLISAGVNYSLTRRKRLPFEEPPPTVTWGELKPERIKTSDGEDLGAWYASGKADGPSILVLHGNGGSRRNVLSRAAIFASEMGGSILLISLRAHGDSTGEINDIGYSARQDVVAAVNLLRERRPNKPVIVFGVSMGSAAAIFAGEELGDRVQAYILESPYRDLETAVWNRCETYLPPILDRFAYFGLRLTAPLVLPDFPSIAPIRAISGIPEHIPILILSGSADRLATPAEAQALFDRVKSHGRIELIEGGEHHGLLEVNPERFAALLVDFSTKALAHVRYADP